MVRRVTQNKALGQSRRHDESTHMRSSKSRSRGNKNRSNARPSGGNIINRVFDSSGPDGKVRGTPQQIIEKYNQLHRDAQLSNDRVNAENFSQHAEHYTRLLAEAQREVDKARDDQENQNRERQAERDRERNERLKAQEAASNDPGSGDQPQAREHGGGRDQSGGRDPQHQRDQSGGRDRRDQSGGRDPQPSTDYGYHPSDDQPDVGQDSGLVETPEAKPQDAQTPPSPARKPRPPRKPRVQADNGGPAEAAE